MKAKTKSMLATVSVTVASYAALEVIRHGLIATYAAPWLLSLGMSAAAVAYLSYAMIAVAAGAIGWGIWKFFISSDEE